MDSNGTAAESVSSEPVRSSAPSPGSDGNAYLYVLIVMSFYGVFLTGVTFGYVRSKRREKRSTNLFTRLLYEEEQREWGARQKKYSFTVPAFSTQIPLVPCTSRHVGRPLEARVLAPLACALCSVEQSSVSSLCSSADVHFTIEEETDGGPGEKPMNPLQGLSVGTADQSGTTSSKHAAVSPLPNA